MDTSISTQQQDRISVPKARQKPSSNIELIQSSLPSLDEKSVRTDTRLINALGKHQELKQMLNVSIHETSQAIIQARLELVKAKGKYESSYMPDFISTTNKDNMQNAAAVLEMHQNRLTGYTKALTILESDKAMDLNESVHNSLTRHQLKDGSKHLAQFDSLQKTAVAMLEDYAPANLKKAVDSIVSKQTSSIVKTVLNNDTAKWTTVALAGIGGAALVSAGVVAAPVVIVGIAAAAVGALAWNIAKNYANGKDFIAALSETWKDKWGILLCGIPAGKLLRPLGIAKSFIGRIATRCGITRVCGAVGKFCGSQLGRIGSLGKAAGGLVDRAISGTASVVFKAWNWLNKI